MNGITLVELRGDIDINSASTIFETVRAAVKGKDDLILSLEHCRYCDSSGMTQVVKLARERRRVVVVAVKNIRRVFEITKLDTIVPVVSSLDDAVVCFKV